MNSRLVKKIKIYIGTTMGKLVADAIIAMTLCKGVSAFCIMNAHDYQGVSEVTPTMCH